MQPNFDEANSSLESNSRTKTIVESNPRSNRLSIKHLMVWLTGVAVGITAGQHLERSHYAAESAISIANGQEPRTAEPMKMAEIVVAVGFGTGISLGILAVMGGPGFWQDPARIGITVFGVMGIIGFLTQLSTTTYVAHTGSRLIGQAGYFFFRDFAVHFLGFVVVCAFTPWLKVRWNWIFAWWCLALFALFGLIIHSCHFPVVRNKLPWLSELVFYNWQLTKLTQSAISVTGLGVAILVDLWKKNSVGWLMLVATVGMIVGQVAVHLRDFFGLLKW